MKLCPTLKTLFYCVCDLCHDPSRRMFFARAVCTDANRDHSACACHCGDHANPTPGDGSANGDIGGHVSDTDPAEGHCTGGDLTCVSPTPPQWGLY